MNHPIFAGISGRIGPSTDQPWSSMVKITFPILAAALVLGATVADAEPFNCNDFPDFRARMNCYGVTSRAPRDTSAQASPDVPLERPVWKTRKPRPQ
jgi:hypothetical protein